MAIQTTFGNPVRGVAGQIMEDGHARHNPNIRSAITEGIVYTGRGVVRGSALSNNETSLPYAVTAPVSDSVVADFAGIVVASAMADPDGASISTTGVRAVAMRKSGVPIGVDIPEGVTIAHGDSVYMSVSHATIPVGQFTNAADSGLIQITDAHFEGVNEGTFAVIKLSVEVNA